MTGLRDYAPNEKWGDNHENVACGYRLRDRNSFCLSSVRPSVPKWHVARQSLRLRRFFPQALQAAVELKDLSRGLDAQALIIWLIVGAVAGWLAG